MPDRSLPDHVLDAASAVLGERLTRREPLRGGTRAVVQRCARRDGSTVIIKAFTQTGEEWGREAAALAVLPGSVIAPRLLASSDKPPLLVMSDLGAGPCVADALLGDDAQTATTAVLQWARAIAALHAGTAGAQQRFARALGGYDATVVPARTSRLLDTAATELAAVADQVRAEVPAGALDQLRALLPAGEASALSPADACPDNNLQTPAGLALLDFEGADYRHVAWDAAYLPFRGRHVGARGAFRAGSPGVRCRTTARSSRPRCPMSRRRSSTTIWLGREWGWP